MGAYSPNDTMESPQFAIAGKIFEIEEISPIYIEKWPSFRKEKGAQRSFAWASTDEQTHKALFERAASAEDNHYDGNSV
jgi:rubrerythrin